MHADKLSNKNIKFMSNWILKNNLSVSTLFILFYETLTVQRLFKKLIYFKQFPIPQNNLS